MLVDYIVVVLLLINTKYCSTSTAEKRGYDTDPQTQNHKGARLDNADIYIKKHT